MVDPVGWRVVLEVGLDEVELVSDRLFAWGALGIEERETGDDRVALLAGMADAASAKEAADGLDDARIEPIYDDGWADAWRAWARPARVADVLIQPAWLPLDPGDDAPTVVMIDPGRSFGSGSHPTTQLALGELLAHADGGRVLDVGCGSGVLAVAVAKARGSSVVAVDTDGLAIEATRANAERNGVSSLVDASLMALAAVDGEFDVVVANILAVTLREIAFDVARVTAPSGVVVFSGMLADDVAGVDAACAAVGLRATSTAAADPWRARCYAGPGSRHRG